jgi:hypothetical protein
MEFLLGLVGIVLSAACLWWSWYYPARMVTESWYGTFASRLFLYLVPAMSLLWLFVALDSFLGGLGAPLPDPVFDTGAVVLFLGLLLSIAGTVGVPLPAPWAPAWMKARRHRDRHDRTVRPASRDRHRP